MEKWSGHSDYSLLDVIACLSEPKTFYVRARGKHITCLFAPTEHSPQGLKRPNKKTGKDYYLYFVLFNFWLYMIKLTIQKIANPHGKKQFVCVIISYFSSSLVFNTLASFLI